MFDHNLGFWAMTILFKSLMDKKFSRGKDVSD